MKELEFYNVQKYIATQEWIDIRDEMLARIEELKDFILADGLLVQDICYSRNIIRTLGSNLVKEYIKKISNGHLKKALETFIVVDNEGKILFASESSNDKLEFSHKDWCRRERVILNYISNFDTIYGQDKGKDNNEIVEAGMNSLDTGISL